ncbi:hypothetical protein TDB9533_01704 [Thalassocella blandensis]|nr:hypothetical protein TDB9533_01704 [Thalassocella blandensis]
MKKNNAFYWLMTSFLLSFCTHSFAQVRNLALHQWATSNSEMQSASLAVDGDAGTRWESEHGVDNVWLSVDLALTYELQQIVVTWEYANAASFQIQGSNNNADWQNLASVSGAQAGERTDTFNVSGEYRYVRVNASQRSTGWGYSIWEFQVIGREISATPTPTPTPTLTPPPTLLVSVNKSATASSAMQAASLAFDGNMGTRWESQHQIDPSNLTVDLGDVFDLSEVVIYWEAANAERYEIQGSQNGSSWSTLANFSGGQFGERTDTLEVSGVFRFVRMNGLARSANNDWGYSIWEMEVWGSTDGGGGNPDPTPTTTPTPTATPTPTNTPTPSPDPDPVDPDLNYTPLFPTSYSEQSSQEWRVESDGTIVTVASGRARSRHESEDSFYTFPTHYFEHRTFGLEIHDKVAAGEDYIAIYYKPEFAHYREPECRSAYSNVHRADFNNNAKFEANPVVPADPAGFGQEWVCFIRRDAHNGDDGRLEIGEWMEVEFQQFLGRYQGDPEVKAQTVYYTDTYRFKIGEPGIYIVGDDALEQQVRAGGDASAPFIRAGDPVPASQIIANNGNTVTYKVGSNGKWVDRNDPNGTVVTYPIMDGIQTYDSYIVDSDVADWTAFFREALNIQWETHNTFMQGRRVFHTFFNTGAHAEAGNPDFPELAGASNGLTVQNACIACHVNNGRGAAPANGQSLSTMVTRISNGQYDSLGQAQAHEYFGSVLQPTSQSSSISAEAQVSVSYSTISGNYNDGSSYQLQRPSYQLNVLDGQGGSVPYYSVRMPQNITGLGLLEAIPESDIVSRHDPDDADGDGISGRASIVTDAGSGGQQKLGRFGWKASFASLTSFSASALQGDMGVTTHVFPDEECGVTQSACLNSNSGGVELSDFRLHELVVYLQALGAPSRRPEEVNNPNVLAGQVHFQNIGCASCHVPEMSSGHRHPLAELRGNQVRAYTDLLLHDMGPDLADNLTNSSVLNREWRTPPLWGMGYNDSVNGHMNLLHDGRARNIEEAILWHGGEAQASNNAFKALSGAQRNQLLQFIESL